MFTANLCSQSYKLKVDACEKGTAKERKLRSITVNYLSVLFLYRILGGC